MLHFNILHFFKQILLDNTKQYNTAFIKRPSKHQSAEQKKKKKKKKKKNKYKCKYKQKAKQIIYKQNISKTINWTGEF